MLNKGIMKCFEAYLYNDKGEIIAVDENMTSSSISQTATENLIKNGADNATWATFQSGKEITCELASNVIDINKLMVQAGASLVKGATNCHSKAEVYTVSENKITLPNIPIDGKKIQIVDLAKDELIKSSNFSVAESAVTFTGLDSLKEVKVLPYEYLESTGEQIVISASQFPTGCKLVLHSIMINEKQQAINRVEIELPVVKPSADWSLSSQSDFSSGMDNTLSLKAQKDAKGNLGKQYCPYIQ